MASQEERSNRTRAALVGAARELFMQRGYTVVLTEEIVARAGVSRGGLYHHFGTGKAGLLEAVADELEEELTAMFAQRMGEVEDPFEALLVGVGVVLDCCVDPSIARLALLDVPNVLGWRRWREIAERHSLGMMTACLHLAMTGGRMQVLPVKPLAHIFMVAITESAQFIANADDPNTARQESEAALRALMEGLRTPGPTPPPRHSGV